MKKLHKLLGLLALFLMGLASPALAQLTVSITTSAAPLNSIDTVVFSGSATLTITFSSTGGGNIQANSVSLPAITYAGSMTNTTVPTTTCGGTTIGGVGTNTIGLNAPGGSAVTFLSCTLSVNVSSALAGTNTVTVGPNAATATVCFGAACAPFSNAQSASTTLNIGAMAAPTLSNPLNFGSVQVFTSSATTSNVSISFAITSGPTYKIVNIASSNPADFTIDPATTCAIGLPGLPTSGGNCTYAIRFTPTTAPLGLKSVTYTITDNAPGSPRTFTLTGTAIAGVPGAPTIGAATPGNAQASIAFTPPTFDGGSPITGYTATCNPGALSASGPASPLTVTGLTNGTPYTCSVTATNAMGTGPASAIVNVTPAVVLITVMPTSLLFNDVTVGSTSAPQPVTVTNGGTFPISVSVTPPTGPFPYSNACPVFPMTLGSTSCFISVQFAPVVVGAGQSGVLSVVTTDVLGNLTTFPVSLSGNGIAVLAPNVSLTPAALDFGTQPVGTTSVAQSLILSNSGNAALSVASVTTSGAFALQPATTPVGSIAPCAAAPFTLAQGTNCFFDVVFSPTLAGSASGSLLVSSSNAPSVSAALTGVGGAGRLIQISPTTFAFAGQVLNVASAPQAFTVTNVGTLAVNITSLLVSSGATDFIVTHNCGVVNMLASGLGNTCSGAVTFQPSAIGARSGIVSVVSDAQGSPHILTLTGNALVQPFALLTTSASSLGFGQRGIANRSATQTIRVTNSGNVPVDISSIYTTGDFYQSHNCPNSLDSAQSCEVGAWFVPSIPGARAGELVIVNNSQDSPKRVGLQGTGCRFFTLPGSRLAQVACKP